MGYVSEFFQGVLTGYKDLSGGLSFEYSSLVNVLIFAILISIYSIFTWKFYRSLSKKDLIALNLQKYNTTTHSFLNKIVALFLYLIEYIIILPFLIFFWFAVLALIILVLSDQLVVSKIIVISAAMVAAVRILSYYTEELARDLAKIFPFTVLAIFILTPNFFSLERIFSNLSLIPGLLVNILFFLILIIGIELILRVIDSLLALINSGAEEDTTLTPEEIKKLKQKANE